MSKDIEAYKEDNDTGNEAQPSISEDHQQDYWTQRLEARYLE